MNNMINTTEALTSVIDRAMKVPQVGFDTEFVWEQTYYPSLGIIQISLSDEEAFLIDAPAIKDMAPLGKLLANPDVMKIFHDAQQDLTILRRATGAFPQNVFDTQCAAGFVGLSSSISLSALLGDAIGVQLPKTETRTDWLKRPLTDRQVEYALDDVLHLHALHDRLYSKAQECGHETWLAEELAKYNDPGLYEDNEIQEVFRRVKGSGRLEAKKLVILRELASWRESEARRRNRPKSWVLSDETLISISRNSPRSVEDLNTIKPISKKEIQRYGEALLREVKKGLSIPKDKRPKVTAHYKDEESLGARVDFVLAYMKGKSMAAGIDPTLVATRAEITSLVREGPDANINDHRLLHGWRREFLGEDIIMLLAGQLSVRLDTNTGLPQPITDIK
ncbi:MAG: ribonuclease D [Chloroflexi bacterium]|nr:ribonuclease D [Chloroflexota bacterium]